MKLNKNSKRKPKCFRKLKQLFIWTLINFELDRFVYW